MAIKVEGMLIWEDENPSVIGMIPQNESGIPIHDLVLHQALGDIWREQGSVPVRITIEVL